MECLTKTFREAVLVTRQLGIRFIWIDSFCIVQDSPEDWARESCEMGHVFENAYLVLAAAHSDSSSGGLLPTPHFPTNLTDAKLRTKLRADMRHEDLYEEDFHPHIKEPFIDHYGTQQPLLQRAWVYQERFLAPRVLFFLEDHLLWECTQTVECECTPSDGHIEGWDAKIY